ncbi:MAG: C-GCAxxG-C-C family protein [Fusobacterium perfoetens]|uniref:C-GCAxxG-C-C family (seleno)protein n=1 Tax=Fusobacterium perfoetens TaxID=852 RepID=UPI0023F1C20C|nr:C-GCAxxG-C-C family (seleno)protein [Fusobacterium perfoetens]MCI6152917.1 C-GCAxxG-C-C family protein [Fusobacterium perfoetens]MDY3237329.1 C-GCAxxG-C-C family (seleno)protein [Fusobacterium perfoetens]
MKRNVNIDEVEKTAVEIFNSGFACSESVIYAIKKHFELELSDDAIAMSSGFPWGLGGGGCICGALAGGTMCLGYFFGRRVPNDPKIKKCFELSKEFHDYFIKNCGASCCRVLSRGMEKESPERKAKCTKIVSTATRGVAEIILRELNNQEK